MTRDLDMSDVIADGERMRDEYYGRLYYDLELLTLEELGEELYKYGIQAREGREFAMDVVQMIGDIRLGLIATSLCEACKNRTGCMMCCPWDDGGLAEALNRDYEEERLGRPLFPNEY